MDRDEFQSMVDSYKQQMMEMAQKGVSKDLIPPEIEAAEEAEVSEGTYAEFLKKNPKSGSLKIQTFAAQQALPVEGAKVIVSKTFADGQKIFYSLTTDRNGIADDILLSAPDKALSLDTSETPLPYAEYDVTVEHPNYRNITLHQVQIFDGIKSIQPIIMIPVVDVIPTEEETQ